MKFLEITMILGVLMTGCTTPPPDGGSTSNPPVSKNPNELIDGYPVSPSQELKDAATEAYNLNRELIALVDPSFFTKGSSDRINKRTSSETPSYKDGNSYWQLLTSSNLRGGLDWNSIFEELKTYLESQGYVMTEDNRDGQRAGPAGTVVFRKDGTLEYLRLGVGGTETYGGLSLDFATADFPNPPVSEWPEPGQNETWLPDVPLWPTGIGAIEPTPPPLSWSPSS